MTHNHNQNLYDALLRHLERYEYKRGQFKGDAPADFSRRAKTHFRVQRHADCMTVVFHATAIITAYPDGSVTLDSSGWDASPTTRDAFAQWGYRLTSVRYGSFRQTALAGHSIYRYKGKTMPFYDGMTLDANGQYDGPPRKFQSCVADRDERREWRNDEDVKAFRAALPVLHAAVSAMPYADQRRLACDNYTSMRRLSSACDRHDVWPTIVAMYLRDTPQDTWAAFAADATKSMTVVVEVE